MRPEIAFGEAAHRGAATIKETLVDWNGGDVAGAFLQRPDQPGAGADFQQCLSNRNEVTGPRGRAKEFYVASDGIGGELESLTEDKTAARHDRTIAQIESVKQSDRTHKVPCLTDEFVLDVVTDNFDTPLRAENTDLVFFGDVVGEFCPGPDFKLGITLEIKRKCTHSNLQFDVAFEKMGIIPQYFSLVSALRNLNRCGQRPAITKKISIRKAEPDDSADVCPVADRKPELFRLRLLSGNIELKRISGLRLGIDLENVEESGPHQLAEFFVQHVRAVVLSLERGKAIAHITRQ